MRLFNKHSKFAYPVVAVTCALDEPCPHCGGILIVRRLAGSLPTGGRWDGTDAYCEACDQTIPFHLLQGGVYCEVEHQRREVPYSKAKERLRYAQLNPPTRLSKTHWIVYELRGLGEVYYDSEKKSYWVRSGEGGDRVFSDAQALVEYVGTVME